MPSSLALICLVNCAGIKYCEWIIITSRFLPFHSADILCHPTNWIMISIQSNVIRLWNNEPPHAHTKPNEWGLLSTILCDSNWNQSKELKFIIRIESIVALSSVRIVYGNHQTVADFEWTCSIRYIWVGVLFKVQKRCVSISWLLSFDYSICAFFNSLPKIRRFKSFETNQFKVHMLLISLMKWNEIQWWKFNLETPYRCYVNQKWPILFLITQQIGSVLI